MCMVIPQPALRASSAAPTSRSSEARSWPTSVTQPSTSPPAGCAASTSLCRSSTSCAGAANGASATSHPQVPTVPRTPTATMAAATRSGWATVPASTSVVTPQRALCAAVSVADSSSSSGVCSACRGTDQAKIDSLGASRSGMQLRTRGSPVWCWWALMSPGVTMHPEASSSVAPRWAARSADVEPTAAMRSPAMATVPPVSTSRRVFIVTTSPPLMSSTSGSAGAPGASTIAAEAS